jgi:hypothetical protein
MKQTRSGGSASPVKRRGYVLQRLCFALTLCPKLCALSLMPKYSLELRLRGSNSSLAFYEASKGSYTNTIRHCWVQVTTTNSFDKLPESEEVQFTQLQIQLDVYNVCIAIINQTSPAKVNITPLCTSNSYNNSFRYSTAEDNQSQLIFLMYLFILCTIYRSIRLVNANIMS